MRNFQGIFLYKNKYIGRFSNLHYCTFKLSNENYFFALNLLRERFDNEQLQVWTHMKKLLKTPSVLSLNDISVLRPFTVILRTRFVV